MCVMWCVRGRERIPRQMGGNGERVLLDVSAHDGPDVVVRQVE